ncbi:MAG: amidohydrolase family protein [Proteobacteria bacterium]|nr:amidohydrolase family protein [Pseudomonadota bacterium]
MKNIILLMLLCVFIVTSSQALSPTPNKEVSSIVYHNATIHVGNGEVLENATIQIADGKIIAVGKFNNPRQKSDIDLQGKHIYPGFILPNTNLGLIEVNAVKATKDVQEIGELNANIRSIIAYNTDSELTPTLRFNGILLAQTTPQGGLISGLSSIVQLDAWNWEDAAIVLDDAIHVNWPSSMSAHFDYSTFKMKTTKNKKHQQQLAQIKNLFSQAKIDKQQDNLKFQAIKPVFNGNRKVYIHTNDPKAIVAAITYLQKIGVNDIVLVSGQATEPVMGFIKQSGVAVIVALTHELPKRSDSPIDNGYTTAIKLHNAGILVALGYQGLMSSRNLAFTAGTLVAYGMDKATALQLITSNTAKILGIDNNYGTLETGKSATFIITQGDGLDMRSNKILAAYIDGRKINLEGRQQKLNQRYLEKYNLPKPRYRNANL